MPILLLGPRALLLWFVSLVFPLTALAEETLVPQLGASFFYQTPGKLDWQQLLPWVAGFVLICLVLLCLIFWQLCWTRRLRKVGKDLEQEVSERQQVEERLLYSRQIMHDALQAVSNGVWEWNIKTGKASLDRLCKRIFGLPEDFEAATSAQIFAYVEAEDLPGIKAALEEHIQGRSERYDHEFRVNRPDGSLCWVRGRGKVIEVDKDGAPLRLIGTNSDITERKMAEQQAAESERRFSDLIEQVEGIAIQGYDSERRVTFWNQASEQLYGYSATEARGRLLEDLIIPSAMRDEVIRLHTRCVQEGVPIPAGELVLIHKDGSKVPVFSSHVMRQTLSGTEMFCVDVDLAPLKKAEEGLRQARKMETMGTMAGGIAHDFNNSLAVILGSVELALLKLPANNPVGNYLEQAKKAILHGRDLVKQILVYSRQGSQRLQPLNLQRFVAETLSLLRATIPSSVAIEVSDRSAEPALMVAADMALLQQVIINLVNNAVQAMEQKGQVRLSLDQVKLEPGDLPAGENLQPGDYACLRVKDSGPGMTAKVLERIFDPFFTTKEVGQGTGMGLAVAQGVVSGHKGFIRADSQPGLGAEFSVFLPLVEAQEMPQNPVGERLPGGDEKVLLVDDEAMLADVSSQMLSDHGYQVTTASDSRRALELFRQSPETFDLVVTDQTMPGLSGTELIAKILEIRKDTPIILCTGYSTQVSENDAAALGASAFCMKPLNLQQLLQKVRQVLDERH